VAHPKNLNNSIIGVFCETLNNFSTVIVFQSFKSGYVIFVMLIRMLAEAYRPTNLHGFHISRILSCQLKILSAKSCNVQKKFYNL